MIMMEEKGTDASAGLPPGPAAVHGRLEREASRWERACSSASNRTVTESDRPRTHLAPLYISQILMCSSVEKTNLENNLTTAGPQYKLVRENEPSAK